LSVECAFRSGFDVKLRNLGHPICVSCPKRTLVGEIKARSDAKAV
jgi:hypothetical protein